MVKRSWVQIPAPDTRWTFSQLFAVRIECFYEKSKNG